MSTGLLMYIWIATNPLFKRLLSVLNVFLEYIKIPPLHQLTIPQQLLPLALLLQLMHQNTIIIDSAVVFHFLPNFKYTCNSSLDTMLVQYCDFIVPTNTASICSNIYTDYIFRPANLQHYVLEYQNLTSKFTGTT